MPRRPPFDYGPLITSLKNAIDEKGLQPVPIFIKKNIELYEMICADSVSVPQHWPKLNFGKMASSWSHVFMKPSS